MILRKIEVSPLFSQSVLFRHEIFHRFSQRNCTTTLEDGENEQGEVLGPDEQIQIQLERELELLELRREAGE